MNWLLVCTGETSKEADIVSKFLTKKKVEVTEFNLDAPEIKADGKGLSDFIKTFFNETLNKITQCVLFIDEANAMNPILSFLAGFIQGKQIPSFISGVKQDDVMFDSVLSWHENAKNLTDKLDENFPEFIAEEKKHEAKRKLFEAGIPFTPDTFSIHIAQENMETCENFLEAGMDVNCRDSAGTPMLCIAARSGKKEAIEWLVNNGVEIDAISKDRGYSAVMDAVWKLSPDIVELLIKLGANLNFVSNDGQTALIVATGSSSIKICEMLVKNGADPCFKDHMGMSALDYARLFKKDTLVDLYQEYAK
ncbi:MAG: ankyrin repeat domain-containing protein [Treponema sp.]|nr:ankyrin repeat domain-containing protein [Candidatus Treponema caballi]